MTLVFDGNKLLLLDNGKIAKSPEGEENGEFTFTADDNAKPARITLVQKNNAGFSTSVILAFEGDTLKMCYSKFANERITDFKREEKSATVLMTLKRVNVAK